MYAVRARLMIATRFISSANQKALVAKEETKNSLNNVPYSKSGIQSVINRTVRINNIEMPLSRSGLIALCQHLNLHISYL